MQFKNMTNNKVNCSAIDIKHTSDENEKTIDLSDIDKCYEDDTEV